MPRKTVAGAAAWMLAWVFSGAGAATEGPLCTHSPEVAVHVLGLGERLPGVTEAGVRELVKGPLGTAGLYLPVWERPTQGMLMLSYRVTAPEPQGGDARQGFSVMVVFGRPNWKCRDGVVRSTHAWTDAVMGRGTSLDFVEALNAMLQNFVAAYLRDSESAACAAVRSVPAKEYLDALSCEEFAVGSGGGPR